MFKKVLIGCAVVAGVVVVLLIGGVFVIQQWARSQFPDTKQIEKNYAALEDRYGTPESYVPPLDGVIAPDRLARFMAVRDSLAPKRASAAAELTTFVHSIKRSKPEGRPAFEKLVTGIGVAKGVASMVRGVADYYDTQLRVLAANEMGPGEYRYLYSTVYFAWLQWDPVAQQDVSGFLEEADMIEELRSTRARYGTLLATQLGNERDALEAKAQRSAAENAELAALRTELDGVNRTNRFPFIGKLPKNRTAALEPLRARLQATLPTDPADVALDLIRAKPNRHGSFDFDGWFGHTDRRSSKHD